MKVFTVFQVSLCLNIIFAIFSVVSGLVFNNVALLINTVWMLVIILYQVCVLRIQKESELKDQLIKSLKSQLEEALAKMEFMRDIFKNAK